MVSAVESPPPVIVPPDALQLTATATLSPASVRPYATNCRVSLGLSVTESGRVMIRTTGLLGACGPATGRSHAPPATAARAAGGVVTERRTHRSLSSASRRDSLCLNVMASAERPTPGLPN